MTAELSISSRGIKQAGFYVLVGASMPSVLVETGFLSNKNDANYLKSTKGQNEIADAIFKAVKSFKDYYEKVMETEL
ncbi:MAG: N-acetylmuramoyl-L-alanine amidase, partial [Ignavibacteriales bacterium]